MDITNPYGGDFNKILRLVPTNYSARIKVNLPDYPNYATVNVPGPFLSDDVSVESFLLRFAYSPQEAVSDQSLQSPFVSFTVYGGGPSGGYAPSFYRPDQGIEKFTVADTFFYKFNDSTLDNEIRSRARNLGYYFYVWPASNITPDERSLTSTPVTNAIVNELTTRSTNINGTSFVNGTTANIVLDFENWFTTAMLGISRPYPANLSGVTAFDTQYHDNVLDLNPSYTGNTFTRIYNGPINRYATNEYVGLFNNLKTIYGQNVKLSHYGWGLEYELYAQLTGYLYGVDGWTFDPVFGNTWTASRGLTWDIGNPSGAQSKIYSLSDYAKNTITIDGTSLANLPNQQIRFLEDAAERATQHAVVQYRDAYQVQDYFTPQYYQYVPTKLGYNFYNNLGFTFTNTSRVQPTYTNFERYRTAYLNVAERLAGTTLPAGISGRRSIVPIFSFMYVEGWSTDTGVISMPIDDQYVNIYKYRQLGGNCLNVWSHSNVYYDSNPTVIRRNIISTILGLTFDPANDTFWFPYLGLTGMTWGTPTAKNYLLGLYNTFNYESCQRAKTILSDIYPYRVGNAENPASVYFELVSKNLATGASFSNVTFHVRLRNQITDQNIIDFAFNPATIANGTTSSLGTIPLGNTLPIRIDGWSDGAPTGNTLGIHGFTFRMKNYTDNNSVLGTFNVKFDYDNYDVT
jgi:hypothetical protein